MSAPAIMIAAGMRLLYRMWRETQWEGFIASKHPYILQFVSMFFICHNFSCKYFLSRTTGSTTSLMLFPMTLLVLLPASARAGIIPTDFWHAMCRIIGRNLCRFWTALLDL